MKPEMQKQILFGWLGLSAALIVGAGEFMVHYSPSGYAGSEDFLWLKSIPTLTVSIGHFLMVLGMPLYIFGYYHLYLCLRMGSERMAITVLVLGIFCFYDRWSLGSSRALLTEIIKSDNRMLMSYYKTHYEILVKVLRLLMLVISGFWI